MTAQNTDGMVQGTRANYTGNALERVIQQSLEANGYTFVDKKKFDTARYLEQPIYTMQYPIGKGIYETKLYCDFIFYHPQKHPNCMVIESKWQQSSGSVDEKFRITQKLPGLTWYKTTKSTTVSGSAFCL